MLKSESDIRHDNVIYLLYDDDECIGSFRVNKSNSAFKRIQDGIAIFIEYANRREGSDSGPSSITSTVPDKPTKSFFTSSQRTETKPL